jgi:hypothetical protein
LRCEQRLEKALGNGIVRVVSRDVLASALAGGISSTAAVTALWTGYQEQGEKFRLHVGPGEAYTFAVALALGIPAMSNDQSAIDVFGKHEWELPSPVLRAFDLIAFAYQIGILTARDCDKHRKSLLTLKEHLPKDFAHASFEDGVKGFQPRLLDAAATPIGRIGSSYPPHVKPLLISRC